MVVVVVAAAVGAAGVVVVMVKVLRDNVPAKTKDPFLCYAQCTSSMFPATRDKHFTTF